MRAVRFDRFGDPGVLEVVEVPTPEADGAATALVRVVAASINPSDVKNVAGAMSQTVPPRVPGRDYAGIVERGPAAWLGAEVWGTGGDVGFTRDGTHAEYLAVPVESLRRKPAALSFEEASTAGVNFVTAWCGLVEAAGVAAGERVLVIGSSGGVGNAAAQIAAARGARVIGVERREPSPDARIRAVAERLIVGAADLPAATRDATEGRGADVVFDLVGGAMFEPALRCLAPRGRLIEISTGGRRRVEFDVADFYHNESRLFGVDSLKRDLSAAAALLDAMRESFEVGAFEPQRISAVLPLEAAREAYAAVAGGAGGRVVLRP